MAWYVRPFGRDTTQRRGLHQGSFRHKVRYETSDGFGYIDLRGPRLDQSYSFRVVGQRDLELWKDVPKKLREFQSVSRYGIDTRGSGTVWFEPGEFAFDVYSDTNPRTRGRIYGDELVDLEDTVRRAIREIRGS